MKLIGVMFPLLKSSHEQCGDKANNTGETIREQYRGPLSNSARGLLELCSSLLLGSIVIPFTVWEAYSL